MEMDTVKFSFGERPEETGRWPFRLAVLAEFLPRVYETGKPDARFFHHAVDKDNFNETMAKAGMRLEFDVENPLSDQPRKLHVDLALNVMKAFRPERIVEAVPQLKNLVGIRALLEEFGQRKLSVADFKERLKEHQLLPELSERITAALRPPGKPRKKANKPAPPPPAATKPPTGTDDAVDSILEMVDVSDEATTRTREREKLEAALDDFVGADRAKEEAFDAAAVRKTISLLDSLLGRAVNVILHHAEFKRVEALWSGLKFLVEQTDFRKNARLEIINAEKDKLGEAFARNIYQVEYDAQSEVPLAAVIAAYEFDTRPPDMDLLRELAQKAGEIPLVIITSVGASFFGLERAAQLNELPLLSTLLESPEYAKYDGLRRDPSSRWLALGFNRFLLRYAYGEEGRRIKSFDLRESTTADADYLWGNPVWLLASLMSRSHARVGWPTEISGRHNGGAIADLPLRSILLPNGEEANLPLEAIVPDRRLEEFDRTGIIPLLSDINNDSAYILIVPSVHRPMHDPDPAKAEKNAFMASLPYQMYAGEIARFINRKLAEFVSGAGASEIEARFARALEAFNVARDEKAEPGRVKVHVEESSTRPGQRDLVIHVASPRRVLHGRAELQMSLPLRV